MKEKNVISYKNLPTKSPIQHAILWYLALDYFNAPDWIFGVVATIWVLMFLNFIISRFTENKVNIFDNNKVADAIRKTFKEKLEDRIRAEQD